MSLGCFNGLPKLAAVPTGLDLEESLIAALSNDPGVVEAAGAYLGAASVHVEILPERAPRPAVLIRVEPEVDYSLDRPTDLVPARVEVECQGDTRGQARALADAVKALLDPFTGVLGGGVRVLECTNQGNETSGLVRKGDGSDRAFRWISIEYLVRYRP